MLRELPAGYSVKYRHERDYEDGLCVLPKGGRTEAFIFDPQGNEVASAMATCRPDENFDKALGRTIALGRALQELEKQSPAERGIGRIVRDRKRRSFHIQAS